MRVKVQPEVSAHILGSEHISDQDFALKPRLIADGVAFRLLLFGVMKHALTAPSAVAIALVIILTSASASAESSKSEPHRGLRQVASAVAKQDRGGEKWLSGKVGVIVSSLTSIDSQSTKGFSFNRCRIPTQKLVELSAGIIKKYTHQFKWDKECDLNGYLEITLNKPFGFDLKVRNMDEVQRIKGLASLHLERVNGSQQNMKQTFKIEQASVHLNSAIPVAKFNATHIRMVSYVPRSASLITQKNKGMIQLKEFRRAPSSYKSYFSIKNSQIDRKSSR